MPVGTVKFFNNDKGYGFISPDTGEADAFVHISAVQAAGMPTLDQNHYGFISPDTGEADAFVHISAVQAAGMPTLDQNQRVSYELETGRNGRTSAVALSPAE